MFAWIGRERPTRKLRPLICRVFAAKNETKTLAEANKISDGRLPGDDAFASRSYGALQWFHVELAENEGIQATLWIGEREQRSPVYSP